MSNIPPRWGFSLLWWTSIVPSNCWQSSACRTRVLSTAESLKESEWNELRHGGVRRNGGKSQDVIFGVSDMLIAPLQPDAEQSCHPAGSRGSALHSQLKGSTDTSKHRQRLQQQHNTVWRFIVPQDDTSQQLASNDCYQLSDWDVASDSQFSSISAPFKGKPSEKLLSFFCLDTVQFSADIIPALFTEGLSCCPVSGVLSAAHCLHHQACLWGHISLWFLKHGTSQGPEHGLWKETGETCQQVQTLTWRTQRYVMTVSLLLVQYWSIFSLEHWEKKTARIRLIQNLSQNAEFNCVWKLTISFGKKNNKSISLYK